ncbi:putative sucrose-phosphate synthase [Vitis vinifera]|uniref:Putative sucrose-phosphate synthase n=1 Tax=Vitis vinifera TaxID=29760 RepID=A0A438F2N7_VITVI|nr:putative sucrose-phosphate synthase [Vitis vinifera]
MAGNDWLNSYLEAIIDAGPNLGDAKSSLLLRERGHFSPTRYFVEEVITGFDETDLHRSWARVRHLHLHLHPRFSFLSFVCVPLQRGVHRKGIPDWKICVGGFGIWLERRSR